MHNFSFFKILYTSFTDFKLFIPVLTIIGFLNLLIYFISGKLLHSPEPILKILTLFLFNHFAAA